MRSVGGGKPELKTRGTHDGHLRSGIKRLQTTSGIVHDRCPPEVNSNKSRKLVACCKQISSDKSKLRNTCMKERYHWQSEEVWTFNRDQQGTEPASIYTISVVVEPGLRLDILTVG